MAHEPARDEIEQLIAKLKALPRYVEHDVVRRPSTVEYLIAEDVDDLLASLPVRTPLCDCGAALTQCSTCAVGDYQAAHPGCSTCCIPQRQTEVIPAMVKTHIRVGSVVQIDPAHDDVFGACFLVVTEIKSWGVQGYVTVPGKGAKGGNAFYRVGFEHVEYIGRAEWALPSADDEPPADDAVDPVSRVENV